MNNTSIAPSTAKQPDLDWSQVRETMRMLNLAVAQIDMAMREGEESIQTLSDSFTSMIASVSAIGQTAGQLQCRDENAGVIAIIEQEGADVSAKMQASIMAFQFYDKLSQRLSHVNHALEALGELVGDQDRLYNPSEWSGLQGKIRARYSMREEQEMFDALLSGATIEQALQIGIEAMHKAEDVDIELF